MTKGTVGVDRYSQWVLKSRSKPKAKKEEFLCRLQDGRDP